MELKFPVGLEKNEVLIERDGIKIEVPWPVQIQILKERNKKAKYDVIRNEKNIYIAEADVEVNKENRFHITDMWEQNTNNIKLSRKVACISAEKETAIRISTEFHCKSKHAKNFDDYQFVIPGAFYNKNDTDQNGQDDYLGTFEQDYKDDRNPNLSVTGFAKNDKQFISLIRADIPKVDTTITRKQIAERHFVHNTDIGSLGIAPSANRMEEFLLRCDYPFYERNSFCLNVDGSEWAAYRKIKQGEELEVSYILQFGEAENLTEASWKTSVFQMERILNDDIRHPFSLEETIPYRRDLLHNSFRDFPEKKNHPCGYVCHFSPRENYGNQNVLEYGFSGNQTMVCYEMLRAAEETGKEEYRERALKTIQFFVEHCIAESGLPNAMYSVEKEEFVYWWTGVLMPFQYSENREELEKFLGNQVVGAMMGIAEKLKGTKGNYCRTMTEAMYYLMLCFLEEKENGTLHKDWLDVVVAFCDKMIEIQNTDGSWYRAYTMEGTPMTYPEEWFGSNVIEQGSGTIFPGEVLALVHEYTGNEKYRSAVCKAADFIMEHYVEDVLYLGGLNDTTHKKSVKIDAVGVMYNMRTLLLAYETTKKERYLYGAKSAAQILASWTYLWDIPFDENTLLGKNDFGTTGWAGCDVIPGCSYVDDEFVEFVPDLMRIAEYSGNKKLAILGKIVTLGMQHGLSMPQRMYGYTMPGIQCEGFLTSLWLSDTDDLEFSGAVAKNKGDDNDTCNGLINGQALYNLDSLKRRYHTLEFDKIIEQIFAE